MHFLDFTLRNSDLMVGIYIADKVPGVIEVQKVHEARFLGLYNDSHTCKILWQKR